MGLLGLVCYQVLQAASTFHMHKATGAQVQDEAAGLVVALLDPQPGETILDACAAPGGKTLFAATRMGHVRVLIAGCCSGRSCCLLLMWMHGRKHACDFKILHSSYCDVPNGPQGISQQQGKYCRCLAVSPGHFAFRHPANGCNTAAGQDICAGPQRAQAAGAAGDGARAGFKQHHPDSGAAPFERCSLWCHLMSFVRQKEKLSSGRRRLRRLDGWWLSGSTSAGRRSEGIQPRAAARPAATGSGGGVGRGHASAGAALWSRAGSGTGARAAVAAAV